MKASILILERSARVMAAFPAMACVAALTFGVLAPTPVAGRAPGVATVPGMPTDLSAAARSKTRIGLSWTAPANTGGADTAISGYRIEYSAPDHLFPWDTNVWEELEANTGSTSTTYDHDHELAPGVRLEYRVLAINDAGVGDPSAVAEATTQAAPDSAGNGAPDPAGVTVNGGRVVIAFDEGLDAGSIPRRVQFQVTINGDVPVRPRSVAVTGATVVLGLEAKDAVDADDAVRVRYTWPRVVIGDAEVPQAIQALQDAEGNLVDKWNSFPATNETTDFGVTVEPVTVVVREGGSGSYTVVLDFEPAEDVVVGIFVDTSSSPGFAVEPANPSQAPDDFPLSGEGTLDTLRFITFTPSNWDTPRTVTVHAPAKDDDGVGETALVRHVVVSGGTLRTVALLAVKTIDAEAETGTPAVPKAWLARFGRTVASEAIDAIGTRMEGGGVAHMRTGGFALHEPGDLVGSESGRPGKARLEASSRSRPMNRTRANTGRELLLASSFQFGAQREDGAPAWAAWGSVATGGFEARVDAVRMDGDLASGFLGADVSQDRWLAGLALSLSEGTGSFDVIEDDEAARLESSLNSLFPYARYGVTDRVSVWGFLGYGAGELTLIERRDEAHASDTATKTGLRMRMGAIGVRGEILSPTESNGLSLAVKTDAFRLRMESGAVTAPKLEASRAGASRLRLAMEGSRAFEVSEGATLTPSAEIGIRHDGGDAETGTGLELGGGIRYTGRGIAVGGAVRTLVAHDESGYEEWGASGTLRMDPGVSGRGLSLTLAPVWGAASSGVSHLWSLPGGRSLAQAEEFDPTARLAGEIGYGIGLRGNMGVATPYAGLSMENGVSRTLRVGTRWNIAPDASLGLEGRRGEKSGAEGPVNAFAIRAVVRW